MPNDQVKPNILWLNDNRERIKQENLGNKYTEVAYQDGKL